MQALQGNLKWNLWHMLCELQNTMGVLKMFWPKVGQNVTRHRWLVIGGTEQGSVRL